MDLIIWLTLVILALIQIVEHPLRALILLVTIGVTGWLWVLVMRWLDE